MNGRHNRTARSRLCLRRIREGVELISYYRTSLIQALYGLNVVLYTAWIASGGLNPVLGVGLVLIFAGVFVCLGRDKRSRAMRRASYRPRRPATVGELIAELEIYDPELAVLVHGPLAGLDPLEIVPEMVVPTGRRSPSDWLGRFISTDDPRLSPKDESADERGAVVLARSRPDL